MFKLCVLTRWDFNFCVRSSPLRGEREKEEREKERQTHIQTYTDNGRDRKRETNRHRNRDDSSVSNIPATVSKGISP